MFVIGWAGNYYRESKRFDIAKDYARLMNYKLRVAGPPGSPEHVPYKQMPEWYKENRALLVTSEYEAHPYVVYESLACGRPVAMPRHVGDCAAEEVGGVVYYDHYTDIPWALETIERNYEKLAEAGVACMREQWAWDKVVEDFVHMFQWLSQRRSGWKIMGLIDVKGWVWDHVMTDLAAAIKPWGKLDIVEMGVPRMLDTSPYDFVLNHPWQLCNHLTMDVFEAKKHILCANGPAFMLHEQIFRDLLKYGAHLSTVSINIVDQLTDMLPGRTDPIFHCHRGVNTDIFKP